MDWFLHDKDLRHKRVKVDCNIYHFFLEPFNACYPLKGHLAAGLFIYYDLLVNTRR